MIIPTNFSTLEKTKDLETLFNDGENVSSLVDYILSTTNVELSRDFIIGKVVENTGNLDELISDINESVLNDVSQTSFESALSNYIQENPREVTELKEKLEVPFDIGYFKDISATGLIGSTSIEKQHLEVKNRLNDANISGRNISLYSRIDTFLNHLKANNISEYFGNTLLENSSSFAVQALNIDNYTMFQKGDYSSLFLGLFKRAAKNLSPEIVSTEFGNIDFFNSTIDPKGNIILSEFEQLLLSKDPSAKKVINQVIKIVSNSISTNNPVLEGAIKDLFVFLKPNIYLEETVTNTLLKEEYLSREYTFEQEYRSKEDYLHLLSVKEDLDTFYSPPKVVSDNLYNNIISELSLREDLIQLPVSNTFKPYVLLTHIYPRKDGVFLQGLRIDKDGNESTVKLEVKNGTTLFYRKKEDAKDPYLASEIPQKSSNVYPLRTKNRFNTEILKKILNKGDTIGDKHIIVGVYPGYVLTLPDYIPVENLTQEDFKKIPYKDIKSLKSAELQRIVDIEKDLDWTQLNKYNSIDDSSLISEGDIIKDPTTREGLTKVVLLTDNKYAYVHVEGSETEYLKPIKKEDIKEARSYVYNQLPLQELNLLHEEVDNTKTRNAKLSTFTDPSNVRDGDFFTIKEGDNIKYGKVINSKIGKAVIWERDSKKPEVTNYLNLQNPQFYTNRKIASSYAMSILRVNNWNIEFKATPDPLNVELRYVVPKGTDTSKMFILPNYYANVGMYKDINYKLGDDEIDVTETIVSLLEKEGINLSGKKIYAKKESEQYNRYERNLTGLNRVWGFDKLSSKVKEALKPLQPGIYFNVYNGQNIDNDIYRITKNNGDTIVAHLNKINNEGKLITFERTFDTATLLNSKIEGESYAPDGSIAGLYAQWGNKNFSTMVDAVQQNLSAEEVTNRKSINILIDKMSETFKSIGLRVEKSLKGFDGDQKARITTDENGDVKIVLNDANGQYSDLVHENLHIYLTLLRYNSLEEYDNLSSALISGDTTLSEDEKIELLNSNIYDKEEYIVNKLVDLNSGFNTFLSSDLKNFMKSVARVVTKHINPEYTFNEANLLNNPLEFLNTKMRDFYGINSLDNSSPYYNLGLLAFEPGFRNWMKNENIILKCD